LKLAALSTSSSSIPPSNSDVCVVIRTCPVSCQCTEENEKRERERE
jgi:hypothetical protein